VWEARSDTKVHWMAGKLLLLLLLLLLQPSGCSQVVEPHHLLIRHG